MTCKIIWDLGEHILQNPENYSWKIIYQNYWQILIDSFLLDPTVYPPYKLSDYNIYESTASTPPFQSNGSPSIKSCLSGASGYKYFIVARPAQPDLQTGLSGNTANCSSPFGSYGSLICSSARIVKAYCPVTGGTKQLQILDGGIESIYNINNTSSVIESDDCCAAGTIDCGDCCLDCNQVFNEISALRSLLSRIR